MEDHDRLTRHWLSVHENVRKQIKRLVTLLALIAAVSVVHGVGRLQNDNEIYQITREFTLQLQKEGPREEVAQLFDSLDRSRDSIRVWLGAIPEISWELERYVKKNHQYGFFDVGGYRLGYAVYYILLYFVPLVILIIIYLRIRTSARIAARLRDKAVNGGEIQQCLNSLYSERATERLGEWRLPYATVWILVIMFLTLTPSASWIFQSSRIINAEVSIDAEGNISPLPEAELNQRTVQKDKITSDTDLLHFLAILVLGFLLWRSTVKQLKPNRKRDSISVSNAT